MRPTVHLGNWRVVMGLAACIKAHPRLCPSEIAACLVIKTRKTRQISNADFSHWLQRPFPSELIEYVLGDTLSMPLLYHHYVQTFKNYRVLMQAVQNISDVRVGDRQRLHLVKDEARI